MSDLDRLAIASPPIPGGTRPLFGGMLMPTVLFIFSVYFWESPVVYPIKMLTVFFHEISHGLAAILTGGSMAQINLSQDLGGACWSAGGIRWIILSAGYLGSLLWGSALLLIAAYTRYDRFVVQALGGLLAVVTVIYVRPILSFGFFFGLAIAAVFAGFARYFGEVACDQFLRYVGLTSCLYVILDIKSDLIDRNIPASDAFRLGDMVGLPGWIVGIVWMLLAIVITWCVIRSALRAGATQSS